MQKPQTASHFFTAMQKYASVEDGEFLQRFFKTAKDQYGAGDLFIGVRVPQTRAVCKQFSALPLDEVQLLLDSKVHEHRLAAVIMLGSRFKKAPAPIQQQIFDLYLHNVRDERVNNWDIVDASAEYVIGEYLLERPRDLLFELAKSSSIWQRRVAIISTFAFIKRGDPLTTLELAEVLLHDQHDLIQKAVGWMLREVGKKIDRTPLREFLDKHAATMPRTMLRYAIEHFSPAERKHYLQMKG